MSKASQNRVIKWRKYCNKICIIFNNKYQGGGEKDNNTCKRERE